FNEAGEVVGINGRISIGDRGRVNVGVGFAIASNQIKNFLADLFAGRHAEHGTLDMSAWYMRAPREETSRRGVFVQQTFKDSVVAAAGVALGDELLHFNGELVRSANQLATMVGIMPTGAWVSLGFRAAQAEGGYGSEQTVFVRLTALDTGSSADAKADTERLASRENRRIATQSLLRDLGHGETVADGAVMTLTGPAQQTVRILRLHDLLRLELDGVVLVRTGNGEGFRLEGGVARDLSPEQLARLDREFVANPFLWRGADRALRLQGALLAGGVYVHAGPAFRFAIVGDGDPEQWYFADGRPAGYSFRDPLRKARVELHVCPAGVQPVGDALRVIADGKLEHGWTVTGPEFEAPPAELFRRPR
ncbi:MAG TPA: hypothetical protein VK348_13285, partial [Planctomycetota bacterium]|nr:hypothetical protein [Planctomycetota bacterium]